MQFIRNIAQGGFGKVELVVDQGQQFARKVFSPTLNASESEWEKMKKRFIRECSVQSQLNSPAFMEILSSDLSGDKPWYIMPLAEKTLYTAIHEKDATEISAGLADVLNALEELHGLGYVHRDLKPQNVLKHQGRWKLADFGLILPPPTDTTKLTSMHSSWATEAYCAPEQRSDFGHVSSAADIYAFGCILHDVYGTTYRIPYSRHTAPGDIGAIIEKCTESKPERRFQSIQALRSALATIAEQTTGASFASGDALGWALWLADPSNWNTPTLHAFARYLQTDLPKADLNRVFKAMTDESILNFAQIDSDYWKSVIIEYCDWIQRGGFSFEYCDVVGKRLESIFNIGDIEIKALAALSAAKLAYDHNRWFVMEIVLNLCSDKISDLIAKRIAIEITAMEFQDYFYRCARNIGKSRSDYHPFISTILPI